MIHGLGSSWEHYNRGLYMEINVLFSPLSVKDTFWDPQVGG